MLLEWIEKTSQNLQNAGYIIDVRPSIPGVPALLYAHSPERFRLAFAKVEDHFLFIDWDRAVFSRLDLLLSHYQLFSAFANRGFRVPHALRMQIPNLALVALSETGFAQDVVSFARGTYLNPWYGGETGQVVLVDLHQRQMIHHRSPGRRTPGAYPLVHAVEVLQTACQPRPGR